MGFFSKKKIRVDWLASSIADMVDDQGIYPKLEQLLSTYTPGATLNAQQRKEVLVCTMFFTNRAIQRAWANYGGVEDILRAYHLCIYEKISHLTEEQVKFERLLEERNNDYYRILQTAKDPVMFEVGKYLMDRMNKQPDIVFITGVSNVVSGLAETIEQYVREVLEKFEIVS